MLIFHIFLLNFVINPLPLMLKLNPTKPFARHLIAGGGDRFLLFLGSGAAAAAARCQGGGGRGRLGDRGAPALNTVSCGSLSIERCGRDGTCRRRGRTRRTWQRQELAHAGMMVGVRHRPAHRVQPMRTGWIETAQHMQPQGT